MFAAAETHTPATSSVRAEFGQPFDGLDRVDRGTGRHAERIATGPPHGPQAERELVRWLRSQGVGGRWTRLDNGHLRLLKARFVQRPNI